MKLKNWLNIWLKDAVKSTLKERTYVRYAKIVVGHISPQLGDEDLDSLTLVKLQGFVSGLFKGGNMRTGGALAASTVNAVITVLQS